MCRLVDIRDYSFDGRPTPAALSTLVEQFGSDLGRHPAVILVSQADQAQLPRFIQGIPLSLDLRLGSGEVKLLSHW